MTDCGLVSVPAVLAAAAAAVILIAEVAIGRTVRKSPQ